MNKKIKILLLVFSLSLNFCKEKLPVINEELYTFTGKVYSTIDSQKIYMDSVRVLFREDSTFTDTDGAFSFSEVPSGEYQITFIYTSLTDSLKSVTKEVTIRNEDKFEEYQIDLDEVSTYSLTGKVYSTIDSQNVYMENVKIFFRDDSTISKSGGEFSFTDIPQGEYNIKFLFLNAKNLLNTLTTKVNFSNQNLEQEFLLYETSNGFETDLYPLAIGNTWVFIKNDLSKEYRTIVDTVQIDNLKYYKMEIRNPVHKTVSYTNIRIDPNSGILYRGTQVLTNLNFNDGNHEMKNSAGKTFYWITVTSSEIEIFGEVRVKRHHSITDGEVYKYYSFVKGLGIIYDGVNSFGGTFYSNLVGAVIDGIEYGDTSYVEYNKNIFYYPLAVGNAWYYEYNEYLKDSDTIRTTKLKREIVSKELMSDGKEYFKIKNTFDDSTIALYEWQRMDSLNSNLFGFSILDNEEYLIDNYSDNNGTNFQSCESYMPSILLYSLNDFTPEYSSEQNMTYYGWSSYWQDVNGEHFNETFYEFTKNIGISKIKILLNDKSPAVYKEIKLIGSIIDGNSSGTIW